MKKRILQTLLVIVLVLCGITGCSSNKSINSNIVKGGECYEVDNVSFYYPNQFSKTVEDFSEVRFEYNDAIYEYDCNKITDGNQETELVELFRLDLENEGNMIKVNTKSTLDNGDACYEIVCENDDTKSKYILVFEEDKQITLMYLAPLDEYDESIDHYLYSLVVLEEEEVMLNASNENEQGKSE